MERLPSRMGYIGSNDGVRGWDTYVGSRKGSPGELSFCLIVIPNCSYNHACYGAMGSLGMEMQTGL